MRETEEHRRLDDEASGGVPWKKWGPYLSERQWGTVREDYSQGGDAWNYFTHEQARSRAYRWGEDGLAGLSDDKQRLCFALALWNERDPILKERLFGLTNNEGNHGEDVKEYYFYVDSTPTHSYMKYLYKYPQAAYPYEGLLAGNRARGRYDLEYELLDTGVFEQDRRIALFEVGMDEARLETIDRACQVLADQIWYRVSAAAHADPRSVELGLLGSSAVSMASIGYTCGLAGKRFPFGMLVMPVLVGAVVVLVFDIAHPQVGIVRPTDEEMVRLRDNL